MEVKIVEITPKADMLETLYNRIIWKNKPVLIKITSDLLQMIIFITWNGDHTIIGIITKI